MFKSSADQLPEEAREALDKMLKNPGMSYTEVTEETNKMLESMGIEARMSRSSVGRRGKTIKQVEEKLTQSRVMAQELAVNFGFGKDSGKEGISDVVNELMRHLIFERLLAVETDDEEGMRAIKGLATALHKVEDSARLSQRTKEEIRKVEREKAQERLNKVAKEQGISAETVKIFEREVLGHVE